MTNVKPEVGRYADEAGKGSRQGSGFKHGPAAGWRLDAWRFAGWRTTALRAATVITSVLLLSTVAGVASLLAGALFLLPVVVMAAPFLIRRRRRRADLAARRAFRRGGYRPGALLRSVLSRNRGLRRRVRLRGI
jgi:hypothetical protein